jgi:hypothetical protein
MFSPNNKNKSGCNCTKRANAIIFNVSFLQNFSAAKNSLIRQRNKRHKLNFTGLVVELDRAAGCAFAWSNGDGALRIPIVL